MAQQKNRTDQERPARKQGSARPSLRDFQQRWRTDFLPRDPYVSREFLQWEKERLWPRVWQLACREEEIPRPGDYIKYDIADESLIVVRQDDGTIKALFNVCSHRGRMLADMPAGHTRLFHCRFHGWQFNIDGALERVIDPDDWAGCPDFTPEHLNLKEAKVGTWAGFVFVNPDADAEPLMQFLQPIPGIVENFEIETHRYRWYKTIKLPCNWKVALEAFNEGYHAFATHPQMMGVYGDDWTRSSVHGRHAMFAFPGPRRPLGAPTVRLGKPVPDDLRPGIVEWHEIMETQLAAEISTRDWQASYRLLSETSADMPFPQLFEKLVGFYKDAAHAAGAGWPEKLTMEEVIQAGADWHVFPNFIFLPFFAGTLAYRSRPSGDDPDWCIFDIFSLVRYAPGAEPPLVRESYLSDTDWKENVAEKVGLIPSQDIANMHAVQKGMKSAGFSGARPNPLQESAVSNFHRALYEFLSEGEAGDTGDRP